MFEQHPVPQQISSYQFRLVGDMTLKQFFQLAAGAVLGLIIYATPLPSLFKWPLIIIFVIAGAAFAFLPLQERPLEEWISAFFRAVYGPTLFHWKKDNNVSFFAPAAGSVASPASTSPSIVNNPSVANLEIRENNFLSNIANMFTPHKAPSIPSVSDTTTTVGAAPAPIINQPVSIEPQAELHPEARILTAETKVNPYVSYTPETPKAGTLFVATPVVQKVATDRVGFESPIKAPTTVNLPHTTSPVTETLRSENTAAGSQVKFSPDAAPPSPATIPNVIVGQVMDVNNKIVEGAILEIKDFQGRPVRALKTNKAGHFMIVTPLPNGSYKITVEKDGLTFKDLTFDLRGALVEPMAIKAQ